MKLITVFFALSFSVQIFAQDNSNSGQIRVYDSYQPTNGSTVSERNKISINPLNVLIGDYSIFYERMITDIFSIEASVGLTYTNYMRDFSLFDSDYQNSNINSESQMGITYSIAPKLYLNDDDFEGTYISLYFRSRTYNSIASSTDYSSVSLAPTEQYYRFNTGTFNFGHNYHLGNHVLLDCYVGVGLRFTTNNLIEESYSSTTGNTKYELVYSQKTGPTGVCGMKVSYIF